MKGILFLFFAFISLAFYYMGMVSQDCSCEAMGRDSRMEGGIKPIFRIFDGKCFSLHSSHSAQPLYSSVRHVHRENDESESKGSSQKKDKNQTVEGTKTPSIKEELTQTPMHTRLPFEGKAVDSEKEEKKNTMENKVDSSVVDTIDDNVYYSWGDDYGMLKASHY